LEDSFLCYLFDRVYSYFDWRASSDSSSQNLSSSVRRWAVFGLIPSDSCFFCPKGGPVRTHSLGFLLLLSEGAPTSDSFSRILAFSVRRCSDFGLNSSELSLSCPKGAVFGLIPSGSCFFCPKVPRLRTQFLGFLLNSVRRCSDFGLMLSDSSFSCPNK